MASPIHKILIVDTDSEIITAVTNALKVNGFSVISSGNSLEAIKIAAKKLPHLILVDLMMPELDGIDICIKLRHNPKLSNTLIVFHNERNEDYLQIAAFNAGADDYIIKPLKPNVLVSRLKALLRRRTSNQVKVEKKRIKGLIIDREQYLVFKDGKEIILPRKEFELLSLLYSSPNKVFTRKEISELIWGYEFFSKNRTIDVHICNLREKLGEKHIKTIKGIGYSIEI